jgi:uncharacterized membrane protein
MKIVMTIIGVILVILMFPLFILGNHAAQTTQRTDNYGAVTTGGGITTTTLTLVTDLYENNPLNVVSITSSLNTDVPIVGAYTAISHELVVNGLTASETRTLTVTYEYAALTGTSAAAGTFFGFMPLLVVIAIVVIVIAALVAAFKNR